MADDIRGITCPDMRRVVREAIKGGWRWGGFTGATHCLIIWPPTDQRLVFGSTPSVASWKTLATDIKKVSGVEVWRKGSRKVRKGPIDRRREMQRKAKVLREHERILAERDRRAAEVRAERIASAREQAERDASEAIARREKELAIIAALMRH